MPTLPILTGLPLWFAIIGVLLLCTALFFGLQVMPRAARRPLIVAVTFIGGAFFALEFLWPVGADNTNFLTRFVSPVSDVVTVLQTFAIGLGIYSLVTVHLRTIALQRKGWGYSVVLIGAILALGLAAFLQENGSTAKGIYTVIFKGAFNSLNAATFSIIAFYIASAAYRALRIRSVEATILFVAALIVMLGQVSIGQALTNAVPATGFASNFRIENIANWVRTRVGAPATLAVDLGIGVGTLATALRLWLSLERGSYFEKEI